MKAWSEMKRLKHTIKIWLNTIVPTESSSFKMININKLCDAVVK